MARLTVGEIFDNVRTYLDTDDLNFPNDLLNMMLQRLWFQAVTMEREWRFFQRQGTVAVPSGSAAVPMAFDTRRPSPGRAVGAPTVGLAGEHLRPADMGGRHGQPGGLHRNQRRAAAQHRALPAPVVGRHVAR